MTLNTQREKEPLRRRGSTPIHPARLSQHPSLTREDRLVGTSPLDPGQPRAQRSHPPLGQSASYHPGDKSLHYRAQWSSDSDDDSQSDSDCVYRVVLLGDHGVGKTSLAGIFAGITDKDEQPGGGTIRLFVVQPSWHQLIWTYLGLSSAQDFAKFIIHCVSLPAVVQTVEDSLTTNWGPRTHRSNLWEMIYLVAVCLADCSHRPSPGGCSFNCIFKSVDCWSC